jgi:NAD(P)-dependent dehydrogenase (short-subunit alcohol dehydrogenase family)
MPARYRSSMGLLDGRVAVVTGSGRGIGREIALCFAREGASVVVNDVGASLDGRSSEGTGGVAGDAASATVADIEALGGRAVASRDSVADYEGAGRIIQTAVDAFGRLDILVNNAGIVRDRTLLKMAEEDYDAVVAVHQKGAFNCTQHAAKHMREAGYGRVVNMTSSAGLRGNFGQTNYAAAKAAIMGMTFVWALELQRYGITVNAVAPAGLTRMTEGLFAGGEEGEKPADEDPALNAPLVAYLASEESGWVNGQVFGRTGYAFTIFQTPRQVAAMWKDGGWTPQEVAAHLPEVLGQHLQPLGMPAHALLGGDSAATSATQA